MRKDVRDRINQEMGAYTENEDLQEFTILHMYPKGLAYPNGFINTKFFELAIFNPDTLEKRTSIYNGHDGIRYEDCEIASSMVYADGAFLIRFAHPVKLMLGDMNLQLVYVTKAN